MTAQVQPSHPHPPSTAVTMPSRNSNRFWLSTCSRATWVGPAWQGLRHGVVAGAPACVCGACAESGTAGGPQPRQQPSRRGPPPHLSEAAGHLEPRLVGGALGRQHVGKALVGVAALARPGGQVTRAPAEAEGQAGRLGGRRRLMCGWRGSPEAQQARHQAAAAGSVSGAARRATVSAPSRGLSRGETPAPASPVPQVLEPRRVVLAAALVQPPLAVLHLCCDSDEVMVEALAQHHLGLRAQQVLERRQLQVRAGQGCSGQGQAGMRRRRWRAGGMEVGVSQL